MIYLLSQMILALAVAIVLGVALGWIIHRSSHHRIVQQLKHRLARQHAQLAQAQSDVSMLTDDYDELHRQTQDEITALRVDNQQIPSLATNLEKSQLLVQQMMKRHEAKVRDLTNENQRLGARLASQEKQTKTKEQLAAKLDERQQQNADTSLNTPSGHAEFLASKPALYAAAESDDDPFDEVMEVADELQRELDDTAANAITGEKPKPASRVSAIMPDAGVDESIQHAETSQTDVQPESLDRTDSIQTDEASDNFEFDTSEIPDNQVFELLDGSTDAATLFDPVSQQDDLQQIFGIGPLTEKALNELGITSYSQLAELKQHDIQRIADVLEIGASRIERDNWVGNARRQLEEVLEQL